MAKQLWLLRHGEAESHGTRTDAERALTVRGRDEALSAGLTLLALGLRFEAIYASPKVRARDTARLAAGALDREVQELDRLASDFEGREALDLLAGASADARVLIVGHEPTLSQLVNELTGARVDLKTGGLAAVRLDGGRGELVLLLRPAETRLIAEAPLADPA